VATPRRHSCIIKIFNPCNIKGRKTNIKCVYLRTKSNQLKLLREQGHSFPFVLFHALNSSIITCHNAGIRLAKTYISYDSAKWFTLPMLFSAILFHFPDWVPFNNSAVDKGASFIPSNVDLYGVSRPRLISSRKET
jgi:hypothetical protein